MSDGMGRKGPHDFHHQGPDAPSAHCRLGYPLSGCVPAEPDSVSPRSVRLASTEQCGKPPSDTGVMPQKILLYRFPTEKRARSYPLAWEQKKFNDCPVATGLRGRLCKGLRIIEASSREWGSPGFRALPPLIGLFHDRQFERNQPCAGARFPGRRPAAGEPAGATPAPARRMVALRLDRRLQGRIDPSDVIQDTYLEASTRLAEYLRNPSMPFFCGFDSSPVRSW